jgi:hypothetical protein
MSPSGVRPALPSLFKEDWQREIQSDNPRWLQLAPPGARDAVDKLVKAGCPRDRLLPSLTRLNHIASSATRNRAPKGMNLLRDAKRIRGRVQSTRTLVQELAHTPVIAVLKGDLRGLDEALQDAESIASRLVDFARHPEDWSRAWVTVNVEDWLATNKASGRPRRMRRELAMAIEASRWVPKDSVVWSHGREAAWARRAMEGQKQFCHRKALLLQRVRTAREASVETQETRDAHEST